MMTLNRSSRWIVMSIIKNKFSYKDRSKQTGFTLLEILIALFVFTIVSLLLATSLRSVIDAQQGTEKKAERLRHLETALLVMSRDIEQMINRPITNASGQEEPALIGNVNHLSFTHTGLSSMNERSSSLQRVEYLLSEGQLWRKVSTALDEAPQSSKKMRPLLAEVTKLQIQYLDQNKRFHSYWPTEEGQTGKILPLAIRVSMTIAHWGMISQLYVLPTQSEKKNDKPHS